MAAAGGSGSIQVVSEIEKLRYIPTKPKFGKFIDLVMLPIFMGFGQNGEVYPIMRQMQG